MIKAKYLFIVFMFSVVLLLDLSCNAVIGDTDSVTKEQLRNFEETWQKLSQGDTEAIQDLTKIVMELKNGQEDTFKGIVDHCRNLCKEEEEYEIDQRIPLLISILLEIQIDTPISYYKNLTRESYSHLVVAGLTGIKKNINTVKKDQFVELFGRLPSKYWTLIPYILSFRTDDTAKPMIKSFLNSIDLRYILSEFIFYAALNKPDRDYLKVVRSIEPKAPIVYELMYRIGETESKEKLFELVKTKQHLISLLQALIRLDEEKTIAMLKPLELDKLYEKEAVQIAIELIGRNIDKIELQKQPTEFALWEFINWDLDRYYQKNIIDISYLYVMKVMKYTEVIEVPMNPLKLYR